MSLKPHLRFICINLFIVLSSTVYAADTVKENKALNAIAQAQQFISEHKGRFNGKSINYTATAGETYLRDKHGKETASIFTFAYTKKNNNKKLDRLPLYGMADQVRLLHGCIWAHLDPSE
jgi:carboxypeptidase C (cathepsin A)